MSKLNIKQKDWFLILSLFLIALILRLIKIRYFPLWHDEIIPNSISGSFSDALGFARKDGVPPFFDIVNIFLKNLSHGDIFVQKLPMVLCGALSVVTFYDLLKFLKIKYAFLFSLIPATSYILVFYSQDLRFYSYFLLFALLSFYYGFRTFAAERKNLVDLAIFSIAIILLPLIHYFALYHLAVLYITLFIFIILRTKDKIERIIALIGTIFIAAAGYIPWIDEVIKIKERMTKISPDTKIYHFDTELAKNVFYKITGGGDLWSIFIFILLIGLTIYIIYSFVIQYRTKKVDLRLIFALYCLIYLLILLLVFFFLLRSDRMMFSRYFIYLIWPILALLCIGINNLFLDPANTLSRKAIGFTLIGLILVSNIFNITLYLLSPYRVENYKELAGFIDYLIRDKNKSIIYSNRGGTSIVDDLNYYLPKDNQIKGLLKDGSRIEPITEELERNKKDALFLDFIRYPNLSAKDQEIISFLENTFSNKKIFWRNSSVEWLTKRNLHQDLGMNVEKGEYFIAIIFY